MQPDDHFVVVCDGVEAQNCGFQPSPEQESMVGCCPLHVLCVQRPKMESGTSLAMCLSDRLQYTYEHLHCDLDLPVQLHIYVAAYGAGCTHFNVHL